MDVRRELTGHPPSDAYQKILGPMRIYNEGVVGSANACTLAILLRDAATDEIVGGLWANALWGSFYVALLFVPEALRGTGLGASLMRQAEEEAIRRGCREMWTDTFAFQARPFYEKLGFTVFGQLDGPAPVFPRFFLRKTLPDRG
jgi:GNAT superfamily N-acetyltransferase